MDPKPDSDYLLIERMKAGDEEAFLSLYRQRRQAIHSFALQMSGSAAVAEDVTQDVFLAFLRDLHNYDPARGALSAYLYGMARNISLDYLKRARGDVAIDDSEIETVAAPAGDCDPLGDLTRAESLELLRRAIGALPPHYREVLVLCDLHEMNYAGAAEVLGCAVGTVRSRLHRAREMLLKKFGGYRKAGVQVTGLRPARCYP